MTSTCKGYDAHHGEANASSDRCDAAFRPNSQAAIAADQGEHPFDNRSFGKTFKTAVTVA